MAVNNITDGASVIQIIESGVVPDFVRYKKFGRASAAGNGVWSTIWDGSDNYPYSSVNLVSPTIVSSNSGDTQTIQIEAVDEEYNYVMFEIALTGDTPVPITIPIMQVFRMENMGATDLAGTITLAVSTTEYAIITNGANNYNQTQMAIMVIPAGWYGIVTKVGASLAGSGAGEINFRSKKDGEVWKVKRPLDITSQISPEEVDFFFCEKTILDVRVKPTTGSTAVSAWFDIILIKKEKFHALWGEPKRTFLD